MGQGGSRAGGEFSVSRTGVAGHALRVDINQRKARSPGRCTNTDTTATSVLSLISSEVVKNFRPRHLV
ncbi:unnamed protein product [Sphagnum troendelagicum]|uniref:Uncharacterized protein n=1 Tax=Sphagnum troendelagicum TaxID=128251 RepID=A0ABP0UH21_9BRYO